MVVSFTGLEKALEDISRREKHLTVDLVVKNGRVVTPDGIFQGGVAVEDGRIFAVGGDPQLPAASRTIDVQGKYILPGIVDPHTHPGKRDFATDIKNESRVATIGGVTTIGAIIKSSRMAEGWSNEPPKLVSYKQTFAKSREAVDKGSTVDMFFTFAIGTDEQAEEIPFYAKEYGVTSFKFYLGYMGGNNVTKRVGLGLFASRLGLPDGFDDGTIYLGFENIGKLGPPCFAHIHAENMYIVRIFFKRIMEQGRSDLAGWDARSPHFAEAIHVRTYAYLAKVTGAQLYVVHINTPEAVEEVQKAKAEGVKIIAEANPQHLFISSSDDPPGYYGKLTPPIRDKQTADRLVELLRMDHISIMGTDHVPSMPDDNVGPGFITEDMKVYRGAGGIGMQTLLPAMLSEGVNKGRLTLERVVEVCCKNPAWASGLYPKKGSLWPGADADIVVVDTKLSKKVTPETIESPYNAFFRNRTLQGWPTTTIMRGNIVFEDGVIIGKPGTGVYLPRKLGSQLYPLEEQ